MQRELLAFVGIGAACLAPATTLYDAASNVVPDSSPWNWTYASIPGGAVVTPPNGSGFVTLDTTASMGIHAGWLLQSPVTLDRSVGYDATWNLKVVSESHNADNQRAGLSVIVLGNDDYGVELGFWNNKLFAYNADFTPGENFALDTTSSMHTYDLKVSGNSYALWVDGSNALDGALRNYSAAGLPYNVPNELWVGDDTTRGQSISEWQSFTVQPAPEPTTLVAIAAGALVLRRRCSST